MVGGGTSGPATRREHLLRVGQLGAHACIVCVSGNLLGAIAIDRKASSAATPTANTREWRWPRISAASRPFTTVVLMNRSVRGTAVGSANEDPSLQESRDGPVWSGDPIDERR